jgi:hypothetical protein
MSLENKQRPSPLALTSEQLDRLCEEALVIAQMDRDATAIPLEANEVKLSQAD